MLNMFNSFDQRHLYYINDYISTTFRLRFRLSDFQDDFWSKKNIARFQMGDIPIQVSYFWLLLDKLLDQSLEKLLMWTESL